MEKLRRMWDIKAGEFIEKINQLIVEYFDNELTVEQLEKANSLQELGADSLDIIELQIVLEHAFEFEDETDGVCQIRTLRDVYTWVAKNILRVNGVEEQTNG